MHNFLQFFHLSFVVFPTHPESKELGKLLQGSTICTPKLITDKKEVVNNSFRT